ncbi:ervatamin-B-like [Prosopis cineraria]|uniref:ervatamin-B-like n=1 Tax=Prosopis cineraria TaxID=364024 RepID=UPI00240F190C|nr:ervatamin-B-like [Prosopis cineraria]
MVVFYNTKLYLHSLVWCSLLICLSSGFSTKKSVSPSEGEQDLGLFQQWMKQHGRIYSNSEESEARYDIFRRNLKYIRETNSRRSKSPSGYHLGLNKFADMSPEEFRQMYLHPLEMPATTIGRSDYVQQDDSCAPPATWDWRKQGVVTEVKNQQSCGSCWAFAATGAMESIHAISTGKLFRLSEQELVDCDTSSHGCAGGWSHYAFEWVIQNGGISEEDNYPYVAQKGACKANMHDGDKVVKISKYTQVPQSDDALKCATSKQPVTVAFNATDLQFYEGGIYDGENCPKDSTGVTHIALIVGYDSKDGTDYWIVKNSWGDTWGMNGYFFIQRNTNLPNGVCSLNAWAYVPNI